MLRELSDIITRLYVGWLWNQNFDVHRTDFYFLYSVHASSGSHPASYPVGTEGSFPCSKVSL